MLVVVVAAADSFVVGGGGDVAAPFMQTIQLIFRISFRLTEALIPHNIKNRGDTTVGLLTWEQDQDEAE